MKKIQIRKDGVLYIKKSVGVDSAYCDFCGDENQPVFESEWEHRTNCEKSDMQICFSCIGQLYKLLPKK